MVGAGPIDQIAFNQVLIFEPPQAAVL